ncbi:DA1-related 2 protein [Nymphaea thermarum]|nr:DA1-related 2 protein [Nymphaea thermarum]
MRWLSKLFKGSNHRITNGRCPRAVGDEKISWHVPVNSLDERSKSENEDLDHALALSLDEEFKKHNGYRPEADSDEDLARAIQESMNVSLYPPHPTPYTPGPFFHPGNRFYLIMSTVPPFDVTCFSRICGGCHHEIFSGRYLSCMGAFWHPQCFRCHACGEPITESEFSLSGSDPYHKHCYKELHHPKCDVCHHFIPTNRAGLIEYRAHPFWGQKYCPSHEHDNTPRCCSCERMESRNTRFISLEDGRCLCLECLETAVMDTGECQPLYHAIRDYYEGMNMKLDQEIPMLLVERQALNDAMEGEKGHHHMPETRGLCLSEEQTVTTISKKPDIGENKVKNMRTQQKRLTRRCEVTAILILYGLPRLLTGSILAHELMHGWLRLKGYRNLNPEVEEGICQVLSFMWLESEVMAGSSSGASSSSSSFYSSKKTSRNDVEKKLGKFFMHQIAHDTSTAYGDGFRAANRAVNQYGLRRTLDHIHMTGQLPL